MRVFKQRTEAPAADNPLWISTKHEGLSPCIIRNKDTGSVLPNCVGYAWGRFYELTGDYPLLSTRNAENWWGYTQDGYQRSSTPIPGAVACWEGKGSLAGHVAIVEEVQVNGEITVSASNYSGAVWYRQHLKRPYNLGSNYIFQGFIIPPHYAISNVPLSKDPIYLSIGYASKGDIQRIETRLDLLFIGHVSTTEGYIQTTIPVSAGDQVEILNLCEELGVSCIEYVIDDPDAMVGTTTLSFSLPKELDAELTKWMKYYGCKRSKIIVTALKYLFKILEGQNDGSTEI